MGINEKLRLQQLKITETGYKSSNQESDIASNTFYNFNLSRVNAPYDDITFYNQDTTNNIKIFINGDFENSVLVPPTKSIYLNFPIYDFVISNIGITTIIKTNITLLYRNRGIKSIWDFSKLGIRHYG